MPLKHLKKNKITQTIFRFKKTSITLVIILCIFLAYKLFYAKTDNMPKEEIKTVEVEKVQLKDIRQTTRFIGTIKSQKFTMLVAKSNGILERSVDSGQTVKKDDLIAKVLNEDIERNYILSQQAEKIAQLQYDRLNKLLKSGVSSKSAVEEKESAWIEYQKKLSDARIALDDINIYAPFDGVIGIFKIKNGSQVQKGDVLVSLYDPSTTIVEFDVPLSIINFVHDKSPVFINQREYSLTHIQKMLDEETHMSPAYVSIICNNCIVGSTTNVDVVLQEKKSVMVIPSEAVILQAEKPFVYYVKDNKSVLAPVTLGIQEKKEIEITSGLKVGDLVIVRGQSRLYPNSPVKVGSASENLQ